MIFHKKGSGDHGGQNSACGPLSSFDGCDDQISFRTGLQESPFPTSIKYCEGIIWTAKRRSTIWVIGSDLSTISLGILVKRGQASTRAEVIHPSEIPVWPPCLTGEKLSSTHWIFHSVFHLSQIPSATWLINDTIILAVNFVTLMTLASTLREG